MKYITIATDISSDPHSKTTTWACYIRYSTGLIKKSGEFKQYYKNTSLAETHALMNALTIAYNNIPDWSESKVVIYNEIEHVLTPIRTKAGNIRKCDIERSETILNIAMPLLGQAADWERRKIKAHFSKWKSSTTPARYAINRWCDEESRRLVREIRRYKKGTKNACAC